MQWEVFSQETTTLCYEVKHSSLLLSKVKWMKETMDICTVMLIGMIRNDAMVSGKEHFGSEIDCC